jgi:hypothetical protein
MTGMCLPRYFPLSDGLGWARKGPGKAS